MVMAFCKSMFTEPANPMDGGEGPNRPALRG